ncbi:MAG: cyclopropane-fatty-acyl-phospholipid synthase family protein [Pseudomonadota bacterium]|nr:cyclopropane-fatty-acyl-phospholipid synthase family protein [Pseudomonadota bacterium]
MVSIPGASPEAIRHHYDISNPFYSLWLDPTLTYSAAMWEKEDTLESAQTRKIEFHIDQARAHGARRVLDVGCGWGSVLRRLVEAHGVDKAVGLTLSSAQAEWISSMNLPNVEVLVESWSDYRPAELFDAIISIGAFEHFARLEFSDAQKVEAYRTFFASCRDWLRPNGRLSLQTIAYGNIRQREDVKKLPAAQFLASEIFPESDPPRLADIAVATEGIFEIEAIRNDRKDYVRTCREWLKRLKKNRQEAIHLVGEDVFSRYERCLRLSTIGFDTGNLALLRITLHRIGSTIK